MLKPFDTADNDRRFRRRGTAFEGTLEFPILDPGTSTPDEGILWYDGGAGHRRWAWEYVKPAQVTPISE